MGTCGFTVVTYIGTYIMLYKIAPRNANTNTMIQIEIMIKTLTFNVVAYAFSSILSALLILVMRSLGVHKNAVADAEPMLLCCYTRSIRLHLEMRNFD
ncbi:hypothetical protein L596_021579 [Steinernema carpocapsae]|uniref:Uncharacterized protein n=1 Tax=Steinernema carpocapsae TaxID=34508 RepID=A0A4U5MJ78_STECR|nr:hypothetical protein L596_021579 [Steinernema carpocapsae]